MLTHNVLKGIPWDISLSDFIKKISVTVTVVQLIRDPRARAVSCMECGQAGPVTITNYK